ncbi:multiheme c-type cytochrome [Bacteroidota bacterium]
MKGAFVLLFCLFFNSHLFSQAEKIVAGVVTDGNNPLPGAIVRWQAMEDFVISDNNGKFEIELNSKQVSYLLTAWKEGFYNGGVEIKSETKSAEIVLATLPEEDNTEYSWVDPVPNPDDDIKNCGDCHASIIYKQWSNNGHAHSVNNELFLSIYNGTDLEGKELVQPGYKLDYPHSNGNCSNCHAPTAAINDFTGVDINSLKGIDTLGVSCDFCHKVKDINLRENTSVVTGVMHMELMRPPEDHQIFFGPYTDVPDPDVYSTKISKSIFCAPCHQGGYWGVPVYESYTEWLVSPYSEEGIECQDCHMSPDGVTTNFAPGKGGVERDASTIFTHNQFGSRDSSFLASAIEMKVNTSVSGNNLEVNVEIENVGAGHHVPTDQPMRNMILIVRVFDSNGNEIKYTGDNVIPFWGGRGMVSEGNYEGLPGKGFAKILFESWTQYERLKIGTKGQQIFPAPQWRTVKIKSDTRIPALKKDKSTYEFQLDKSNNTYTVECLLIYRRTFKTWAKMKKFDLKDIILAENKLEIKN